MGHNHSLQCDVSAFGGAPPELGRYAIYSTHVDMVTHFYAFIMNNLDCKEIIINTMVAVAPERADEIRHLWEKYNPSINIVNSQKVTINADKTRI